jgi:hypothetical protein
MWACVEWTRSTWNKIGIDSNREEFHVEQNSFSPRMGGFWIGPANKIAYPSTQNYESFPPIILLAAFTTAVTHQAPKPLPCN